MAARLPEVEIFFFEVGIILYVCFLRRLAACVTVFLVLSKHLWCAIRLMVYATAFICTLLHVFAEDVAQLSTRPDFCSKLILVSLQRECAGFLCLFAPIAKVEVSCICCRKSCPRSEKVQEVFGFFFSLEQSSHFKRLPTHASSHVRSQIGQQ